MSDINPELWTAGQLFGVALGFVGSALAAVVVFMGSLLAGDTNPWLASLTGTLVGLGISMTVFSWLRLRRARQRTDITA